MPPDDPRDVLTRTAPSPDAVLRYGPGPDQLIDIRWPAAGSRTTLVVVLHGGFWRQAYDRSHAGPQSVALAAAGHCVATLEYRRTGGDGGWPSTLEDVDVALRSVHRLVAGAAAALPAERAVEVDLTRTVLVGHSAGGHLAAWAAAAPREGVVGVLSLAGVLDLQQAAEQRLDPAPQAPAVELLLGGPPDQVPDRYAAADPSRLSAPFVPVIALHGALDDTVPISLSEAYTRTHDQRLVVLDGIEHYGLIDPLSAAWPSVLTHLGALNQRSGR